MKSNLAIILIGLMVVTACHSRKKSKQSVVSTNFPGPPTIVYKMKKDYSQNVPVILSTDKQTIVSYPSVEDVILNGKHPVPTLLKNGYYLDNRGIGPDVAFTKFTYEEYSRFRGTPTVEDLMESIIDKDPLIEMYDCGNRLRFTDIETELNQLIENEGFIKKCKKLK
jgi:hypothetical protein